MDYCGFWTIMVLSLILDYHCNIVDSGLSWYIMDYRGLWTIMHYLELSYPGLLWVLYFFRSIMDDGLSWAILG